MTALKLIKKLTELVEDHGNIEIQITGDGPLNSTAIEIAYLTTGTRSIDSEVRPLETIGYIIESDTCDVERYNCIGDNQMEEK